MKKKPKFKDRYVLGRGYPWVKGTGTQDSPYNEVSLWPLPDNMLPPISLTVPKEIFSEYIPKYRLVLEKIK